ncbi:unnamed protein product, partial [Rotaria sp. Silwood1]
MAYASGGGSSLKFIVVGDLNNDASLDIVLANYGTGNLGVLFGYGNGNFENQMILSNGLNPHPTSITIDDFNGDSIVDIAVADYDGMYVDMLLGNGNRSFESRTSKGISLDSRLLAMASGDFNNDKRSDIVIIYDGMDKVDILVSYNHFFSAAKKYSVGHDHRSIATGDFNSDNRLDIVLPNNVENYVSVILGYEDGSFTKEIRYTVGEWPRSVAVGDFNNDNRLDIVVANSAGADVSVLLGYGNGSFAKQTSYSVGNWPLSVAVGDFNNDNRPDIVVANSDSDDVSVLLGYGNGSFADEKRYLVGSNPQSVAVGDFNNDTRLDIVVANWESDNVSVLLGHGNGSFAKQTRYSVGSHPTSVAVSDVNNDNRLDIIVVNSYSNDLTVLLGYKNDSFLKETISLVGSFPFNVAVGDINKDARLDLVVANAHSSDFDFNVYEADEIDNEIETDVEATSLHDDLQQQNLTPDQLHHLFSQVSSELVAESLDDQEFFKREVTIKPPKTSTVIQTPFPPPLSDRKEDFNINVEELKQLVKTEAGPLIIERYSPDKEEIDHVLSTITLTFNQPMIAIASLDEQMNPEGLGISLTPKTEGRWRWIDTKTVQFEANHRLPYSTKYILRVNKELCMSAVGVRDDEHTIQTVELELLDEETAKTEFKSLMNGNEGNRQQYIAFTFKNELLKATQYTIQVPEDCPSAEGPLKTKSEWSADFHTYEPLKIIDWLPNINNTYQKTAVPGENWSLTFNNSLDHSTIKKFIFKFEPEVAIL